MQSRLNFGGSAAPGETLTITGLGPAFTDNGYKVMVFFDMGSSAARTYGFTIGGTTYWTNDVTGTDADSNDDGLMEWRQALGTTSATATQSANYAVFEGLTADSFTIEGETTGGRAVISGLQVVAVPEPSSSAILLLLGAGFLVRRKR
jgi:hypothetical protein